MEAGRGDGGGERRWGEEMGVVRGDVEVGRGDGMGKGDGAIAGSDTVGKLWGGEYRSHIMTNPTPQYRDKDENNSSL